MGRIETSVFESRCQDSWKGKGTEGRKHREKIMERVKKPKHELRDPWSNPESGF